MKASNELEKNLVIGEGFHGAGLLVQTFFKYNGKKIMYRHFFKNGEFFQEEYLEQCSLDMKKYIEEQSHEDANTGKTKAKS